MRISFFIFFVWCTGFFLFFPLQIQAQNDTAVNDIFKLKVEDMYEVLQQDLLSTKVTIASKKSEALFDAPFSVSVLTKEAIQNAGCTSIMEAFRLIPGLVVVEQSNGNYDIHVRGGGNVQRNTIFSISANTTTLVMIDNRPIYNYYLGGTFWETIPIDLNDVERIELVRGPTSAMYGPNAVSGVINIVTRQPDDLGFYAVGNVQQGSNNSFINNLSVGYKFSQKWSLVLSGNSQYRDRSQLTYYNYPRDNFVVLDSLIQPIPLGKAYPNTERAMRKYGLNAFVNFQANVNFKFNFAAGYQNSDVQKAYSENFATPLTTARSESNYLDLRAYLKKFNLQVSYQNGTQDEGLGTLGQKWDFTTFDAVLEYDFNFKNISIKPGFNYRSAIYDDTPYVDVVLKTGQFNGRRYITTQAAYLRGDYTFMENRFRLIAAARLDLFNFPSDPYFSYQLALNYKSNERNLFRLVYSRANRSANIIFTYADRFLENFNGAGVALAVSGNRDLKLLNSQLLELGYRGKISEVLQVDAEAFFARNNNFADFLYATTTARDVNGVLTPVQPFQTLNIPLKSSQWGLTLSLNYNATKFQVRPYVTFQQTSLSNASPFTNTADAQFVPGNNDPLQNNINSNIGRKEDDTGTPDFFGGAFVEFRLSKKFGINLNPYFFSSYSFFSFQDNNYPDGRGRTNIPAKFLVNLKVEYQPIPSLNIFVNARNLLNQDTFEFFKTDRIGISIYGGINVEF